MKFAKVALGGLALALAPLAALAEGMSYNYVDGAYVQTDIDGVGPSADGWALRGSVGFGYNWFAFAEYASQSVQGIDFATTTVGLGGHYALNDQLDLVGGAGWFSVDVSPGGFSDDGYLLNLGLRGRVTEGVELEGGVRYTDLGGNNGDDTAFYAGGRFHFNKTWAIGAEYQDGNDSSSILAYVRASF
jgi:Outer membrane protein beta-barrel domain